MDTPVDLVDLVVLAEAEVADARPLIWDLCALVAMAWSCGVVSYMSCSCPGVASTTRPEPLLAPVMPTLAVLLSAWEVTA